MSLILGLHLLERFYLISDTRVTSESSKSGLAIVKDNLIKAFKFNNRISAIAAGMALPASFILNKLKTYTSEESTISNLKSIVVSNIRAIISEYVNETGYHSGKVAFIIAGFDTVKNKMVEVSLLGNAMSSMVKAAGEGVRVNQSIDNRLTKALLNIGGKKKGDYIEVKGVFRSQMFTVISDIATAKSEIKNVDCYEYAIFHPDESFKTVILPEELLSRLEFREKAQKSGEDQLYEEAEALINFVRRTTAKYEFWTVGGHTFVLLQTPLGNLFPTGDFGRVRKGQIVKAGSFFVENGRLMYQMEDGTKRKYRHLGSLYNEFIKDKTRAYLSELVL